VDVSVIIPTFDRADVLAHTLPRVAAQTLAASAYEIIVIDDGSSSDATARVVAAVDHPRVVYLQQHRAGASAARNAAIARARGDVLVFLDDDAFVGAHFLERHLARHTPGTRSLVAGGIVQVRTMPDAVHESPGWGAWHRHPMPGGNASVEAAAIREVGGFDPAFSTYGWQDQELGERLLAAGLKRRFAWDAPIYHYKPAAYDIDLKAQLARENDRGRMGARFYHKHRRLAVGVTTKVWPPVRAVVSALSRLFAIDTLLERVERGEVDGETVGAWQAALLRARVETAAGARELRRLMQVNAG
jgi:glycosyltransferase involved in cell wall biosynthesis